jgi:2-C-methyl-D-erythritol 4-phosphate cytidylyltransferase/2-C-methyl-D-erythritol 2,4-cyclodiphosphate synthase
MTTTTPTTTEAFTAPAPLWGVLLAAGSGTRLAEALEGDGVKRKQYLEFEGAPLFWKSAGTFSRVALVHGLVFVFPPEDVERMTEVVTRLDTGWPLGMPWRVVAGGARRQDSVRLGLAALPEDCAAVLVHDSARPFASAALVRRVAGALGSHEAVIPGLAVTDTIKRVDNNNLVVDTPARDGLRAVQTPQGFHLHKLVAAHQRAQAEGWEVTDDAALMERAGFAVAIVDAEEQNVKITTPADLALLRKESSGGSHTAPRTGWGYDVHKYLHPSTADPKVLAKARPMMLGGIAIPGAPQVIAHSDGDVLLHALTDALLGIACAGDIGQLFPDTDAAFEGMSSAIFVTEALLRVRQAGYRPTHADLTVIAQTPKLMAHKERMAAQIAQLLDLPREAVNMKATTEEGLGFTGEKRGIKAVAVVTAVAE